MSFALSSDEEQPSSTRRRWVITGLLAVPFLAAGLFLAFTGGGGTSTPGETRASTPVQVGCDTGRGRGLTGIGATPLDWAAHHVATYDPPSGPQTRWNPRPDLPRFRGHEGAVYNDTRFFDACAASSYYLQLARAVPEAAGLARGLKELPDDARVTWRRTRTRCSEYGVSSDRLIAALKARDRYPASTRVLIQLLHRRASRTTSQIALRIVLAPQLSSTPCPT